MKLWAIASNTFREFARDKVLYNIMAFAVLLIGASMVIGELSMSERAQITINLSLTSISAIGIIIAVFLGVSLVSREIDKKTIHTLIAKPVPRWTFILGRFLGLMMVIGVSVAVMTAAFAFVLYSLGAGNQRHFDWPLLQAVILIFIELSIVTAAAMTFSTFSSPTLSVIFTISFFVAGRFTSGVHKLIKAEDSLTLWGAEVLGYVMPDLSNYVKIEQALRGPGLPMELFARSVSIGLLTTAFFLIVAVLIFQRRDFV